MPDHKATSPSVLTVGDLLSFPALQMRLLAGGGGLGRTVSWAHVSELEDPTPWLHGSEVIMTVGLAVPRTGEAQRRYLERLDDAGVAALVLSTQLRTPPLRQAFLAAAEERGFPVLEVPLAVPFVTIAQEVAAAVSEKSAERLGAQLQVFGALRWMAEENLDTPALFGRLEQLSGYRILLCTTQGRPLLPGVAAPADLSVLPAHPDAPPTVPGGFVLPVLGPGGAAGYLVALEQAGARPAGLAVVQHLATVAALRLAMVRQEREVLRREGAETLAEMLQDTLDPAGAQRRLAHHGLDARRPVVLAVVRRTPDAQPGVATSDEDVGVALSDHPHLTLRRGEDRLVLAEPGFTEALAGLPGVVCGVSRPFAVGEPLRVARQEAEWAAGRAEEAGKPLVHYGEDATGRWLPEDRRLLAALVEQVLGEALRYDAAHGSQLLVSVRTWMERDRRTEDAAAALHVHPNTLSYRLRRFGEVTGRDLATTAAFTEVWFAVRAATELGVAAEGP
ncbi:PucR family transcriptional regulator ligand-binding domain-containing protein [Streptomyces sp. NPDC006655]|uniref:PucR family transcriptional regulator n=1 Tax=Streptomyces sp. NPDC006655 TaxID=3156898 RepID=UPI0034526291